MIQIFYVCILLNYINLEIIISENMQQISIKDFSNLVEIGHGAFGTVYKAVFTKNKRTFALKRMQKSHLIKQNMISQINTQIAISRKLKHQNIIKVFDCFQDEEYIYLVLQLAQNGQLYQKLRRVGRFDQNTAKSIIRDVIAAVEYLHSRNPPIVHRDIKPENLLLDKKNNVKLADFGWSTTLNKPRKTYCGTVDYLAPQMIDKSGHDEKLDIWCIGVLTYELLTGRTPFLASNEGSLKNHQAVYQNILNVRIQFPQDFPTLAKDFVMGMIKRNPKERMTYSQIKSHPWLKQQNQTTALQRPQQNKQQTRKKTPQLSKGMQSDQGSAKIIKQLNKKIRQLQEQNISYKIKIQQLQGKKEGGQSRTQDSSQVARLMNEVRKLKVAAEMNQKYKKRQLQLSDQINQKQKEIIKMKTDLKRVQDLKAQVQRVQNDKQKLQQKTKKLQRELQASEQKNRQIQSKLQQANSSYTQRARNGQKISKQQIESPQFIAFVRDQIAELTQKFQQSRQIVTKMLEKQNKERKQAQQLSKLKAQEKKLRQTLRAELREQFQNQKDDLLMKIRNQLTQQKQKWYKQREELKSLYEQGNGASTQAYSTKSNRQQDLQGQLRNVRQLNSYYEKTLKQQKHEIQDLKQQLKRKK